MEVSNKQNWGGGGGASPCREKKSRSWFSGSVHSQVPIWGSVLLHLVRLRFSSRAQCITIAVTQFSGTISEHKTHFLRLIQADAYFAVSNVVPQFVS